MSSSSSSLPATLALVGTSALVAASLTWWAAKARTSVPADLATTQSVTTTTTSKAKAAIVYPLDKLTDPSLSAKAKFLSLYPMLTEELLQDLRESNELNEESLAWCRAMMDYTVPGGKLHRGMTVVTVVQSILGNVSPTLLAQSAVAGWAIEFLQSFFLVADDVMDDSPTRRGQPCWYKREAVKLIAINDSFLLESFVFGILKRHFGDSPCYAALVELLRDVVFKTEVGQLLDLTSQPQDAPVDLARFTLARYQAIVKYKTAFYTFYLPTAMGMLLAGVTAPEAYQVSRTLCCAMGEYFQIQDDYLDCFGEPAVIGKVGTDIQDNKCSWLVVQALERCNPTQRQELLKNYGQWDDKKVAKVKALYRDLDLPAVFAKYEEDSYATIQKELDALTVLPRGVFEILLQKIYKRSK
jgi:farnesyl diphosphate synthase